MNKGRDKYACDLAIVGGGLAGLALAIQAARAGIAVVLFEKETYPFHKVCGEYISMESWDFLEGCGVPLKEWLLPRINRLQLSDCEGKLYDFKLPMGGFGISRYQLDATLYQLALKQGVKLITNSKVTDVSFASDHFAVQAGSYTCIAKIVAGSFGKRSNLDIKWGRDFIIEKPNKLNNYIGVKYHIQYPQLADTISLHNFQDGYCGISRIENDACCLCYLTTAANLVQSGNSIAAMETGILSANPQLKKIFCEAKYLFRQPLTISQISFSKKKQVVDHVLMIGDAAGMITPLCGNGMSMALHASKMAFESILLFLSEHISREEMERRYSDSWKQQFGSRTATGRIIQRYFGNRYTTSVFLQTMHRLSWLANWVIRQTHGSPF
ncbi:MAG: NAD(P)/FAD-dependent oxidoreductase [Sediminibacterium sp.]